jgi:hypothetical protein
MREEPIRIYDHAVLRYLERAMGLNIELVRGHIQNLCGGAVGIGAVCVRAEGLRFEISGSVVTTVTPDRQTPGFISRRRSADRIAIARP